MRAGEERVRPVVEAEEPRHALRLEERHEQRRDELVAPHPRAAVGLLAVDEPRRPLRDGGGGAAVLRQLEPLPDAAARQQLGRSDQRAAAGRHEPDRAVLGADERGGAADGRREHGGEARAPVQLGGEIGDELRALARALRVRARQLDLRRLPEHEEDLGVGARVEPPRVIGEAAPAARLRHVEPLEPRGLSAGAHALERGAQLEAALRRPDLLDGAADRIDGRVRRRGSERRVREADRQRGAAEERHAARVDLEDLAEDVGAVAAVGAVRGAAVHLRLASGSTHACASTGEDPRTHREGTPSPGGKRGASSGPARVPGPRDPRRGVRSRRGVRPARRVPHEGSDGAWKARARPPYHDRSHPSRRDTWPPSRST